MSFYPGINVNGLPAGINIGIDLNGRIVVADTSRYGGIGYVQPLSMHVQSAPIVMVGSQPCLVMKTVRMCEECEISRARPGKRRCQGCKDADTRRKEANKQKQNLAAKPKLDSDCFTCQMGRCAFHN